MKADWQVQQQIFEDLEGDEPERWEPLFNPLKVFQKGANVSLTEHALGEKRLKEIAVAVTELRKATDEKANAL